MAIKNKPDYIKKCMSVAPKFFGAALILCALYLVVAEFLFPDESDSFASKCEVFEAEWYQIDEDGRKTEVSVPGKAQAQKGEIVTLVTNLPDAILNGETLCFRPIWQDVMIYIDGELRLSYNTEETRPFGTNSAFRYLFVELSEEDEGKELRYQFVTNTKYAGTMRKVYMGDRASIWFYLLADSGGRAIIALCLLLLGIFCVAACTVMGFAYKKTLELKYLAWAISLCAFWMLSEVDFRQLIVDNVSVMTSSTYWCLMLIPFPIILYMNEIQTGRYRKLYVITIIYSAINFVMGTILQVFDIVQFVDQLPFIHGGMIFALISIITSITIDVFKKRIKDYMSVAIGIYGLLFSAIIEIILYYMQAELSLGTVLAVGLMFLLIMAVIKTGQDLLVAEKKKQQAITAKEAQAKFLANMSHEIRTPINAVLGMNEMILRENQDETIREYAQNIQSASNMLLELVNGILDFSKIESGQLELVENEYELISLIQNESLLLNARVAGKPISTQLVVDPELPSKFLGDELRIKQVLTNILANAVKYTKRGIVTLKVSCKHRQEDVAMLCFEIIDTGVGIKAEDLPHLFDKFKRLDLNANRNIEGTGLGLNIAKQLVEQMQGNIEVESEYGKGSTFRVFIPQKVVDETEIGDFEEALKESRKDNVTSDILFTAPEASVLVVDDNHMNLSLMRALLKRTQIQVDTAKSGKECLQLTRQKVYDLILMDHMMPGMDGVETLHILRSQQDNRNRNTTVIALTANAIAGSREMYLEYGFDDYLSKPIQADQLEQLLFTKLSTALVQDAKEISGKEIVFESEKANNEIVNSEKVSQDILVIDHELGLKYCLNMEEIYQEALKEFCEQALEYIPQFEEYFNNGDYKQYAVIAHGLKANAKNIGAAAFAELSLKHENAAKENNVEFIVKEYPRYMELLKMLIEKVKELNQKYEE